jgi:phage shock protein PspC (stress-responsive transcriptional regulator)
MKKTITINLSGVIFSIDDDAYELLNLYLKKIESHFSDKGEREDIMADIEARIAELFSPSGSTGIHSVTLEDVEKVIGIMGNPEDIADTSDQAGRQNTGSGKPYTSGSRTGKRIYRDIDKRIFGGVCSGMAAYWSIDVIWIRIIFVILALGAFSGVLIYLLLWIVIPPARTTAQKLEMRGEPVTISNIGKAVRDEFNNVRRNLKI